VPTYAGLAGRKYLRLRDAGARGRPGLGLCRHPVARATARVLRARRLRDGHVPDARRSARAASTATRSARLHGVPELQGTALVLVRLRHVLVRHVPWWCWCRALLAFVFGWFAFRSRVTGVYLSIITQALTFALLLAFFRNDMGFGGNNGFTDFKDILGFRSSRPTARAPTLFVALGGLALVARWSWLALDRRPRKLGKVLTAVRDAESRMTLPRLSAWSATSSSSSTLSAVMAGVAGALYVPQVGIINPGELSPANSIEAAIWVAVGGRGTLIGADHRRLLVNCAASRSSPAPCPNTGCSLWARCSSCVTLFLPKGVVGLLGPRPRAASKSAKPLEQVHRQPSAAAEPADMSGRIPQHHGAAISTASPSVLRRLPGAESTSSLRRGRRRNALPIIGPNGAGKTTMMDVITGKTRPDEGEVLFDGTHRPDQARRSRRSPMLGIGRKFQKPTVFESHSVWDESSSRSRSRVGALLRARLYRDGFRQGPHHRNPSRPCASPTARMGAADLSHGEKQRLEIGMLLAQDPKLLLVERTRRRHDQRPRRWKPPKLLRDIATTRSVVVVEHDMSFVRELGARVTCLAEGSVLAEGALDQVSANPVVIERYLGR